MIRRENTVDCEQSVCVLRERSLFMAGGAVQMWKLHALKKFPSELARYVFAPWSPGHNLIIN